MIIHKWILRITLYKFHSLLAISSTPFLFFFFFLKDPPPPEFSPFPLPDPFPISSYRFLPALAPSRAARRPPPPAPPASRSSGVRAEALRHSARAIRASCPVVPLRPGARRLPCAQIGRAHV